MNDLSHLFRLLDALRLIADEDGKKALLGTLQPAQKPYIVSFLNAHALILASKDSRFAADLLASDLLLRDGVGISLLLRFLGRRSGLNMNGTDLTPQILRAHKGDPIALCGTQDPFLSRAARAVRETGGNVVFVKDGFGMPDSDVAAIDKSGATLVILGMGMPKQERVAALLAARVARPLLVVNGGAILDFLGGRFPRAPRALRAARLEWLFRLAQEPARLSKRYVSGGFAFILLALRLKLARK